MSFPITKQTDHPAFTLTLRTDGILQITMRAGIKLRLEDAKEMVKLFGQIGGGNPFLLLFIAGEDTDVDTGARYYASGGEANKYTIASAFVVKSVAQKLLGNAYVKFNKPVTPTRIFTSEEEAVNWLQDFPKD